MNENDPVITMFEMLRYRRPHKSKTERRFIQRFLTPLGVKCDKFGNRYKRIGDAPIMYSAHTDTVHRDAGMQIVGIRGTDFKLPHKSDSNCLGADNTAGVWMLQQMILAEKPGLYIFHRGEECGGLGSRWLSRNRPDLVKGIKVAMAFDRRGTKSIITHQIGGRCCSDDFGLSLADELKMGHKLDSGGSFTDTASYIDIIPECTNVSVGFNREHSSWEILDMAYLSKLREAVLAMNHNKLVIKRVAGTWEPKYKYDYNAYWKPDREYWDKRHEKHDYSTTTSYGGHERLRYNADEKRWEYWSHRCMCWLPEYYKGEKVYRGADVSRDPVDVKVEVIKPAGFLSDLRQDSLPQRKDDRQGELLPDGHELDDDERPGRSGSKWERQDKARRGFRSQREQMEHQCMMRMIRENPFILKTFLEDYGITASDLADYIFQAGGDVPHEMLAAVEEGSGE